MARQVAEEAARVGTVSMPQNALSAWLPVPRDMGERRTMEVTVTPQSGSFNKAVALTCSGLPNNLGCSFSPASVIPGAGAVNSAAHFQSRAPRLRTGDNVGSFFFATGLFSFGLFGVTFIGKARRRKMLIGAGIRYHPRSA